MADSDPITWQIALLLQSQMQKVLVSGGYFTDIGMNVVVEDVQTATDGSVPQVLPVAIDVNASTRSTDPSVSRRQRSIEFTINAGVRADIGNAKQLAHQIVADIERVFEQQESSRPAGVRTGHLITTQILKRPEGLNAIVVEAKGIAIYKPV